MSIRIGLLGSTLLSASMVIVGLSSNFALAEPDNGNIPGASDINGCGPSGGQPPKCGASVPEPSSLLLLGAGLAGLGLWAWRRASMKA